MGAFDDVKNVAGKIKAGSDALRGKLGNPAQKAVDTERKKLFYSITPSNWYQTFPFYFEIRSEGKVFMRMFLPIPPQSMTTQALSTSDAYATLGGVVEETSKPVFWTITLVGSCGLSASSNSLTGGEDKSINPIFRKTADTLGNANTVTGKLINNAINAATNLITTPEPSLPFAPYGSAVTTPALGDTAPATFSAEASESNPLLTKFLGQLAGNSPVKSTMFSNGFAWSHALKQFFMIYAREKELDNSLSLHFVDVKNNSQYRVVERSSQFQQLANSPFQQSYNIVLKCWNLSGADTSGIKLPSAVNRFGEGGDLKEVRTASAAGVITKTKETISKFMRPKDVAGALIKNSISF